MENYVGKRIDGRYEIQDVIGVGGMAVVYKAYDNIDDRIVAVKILKDEFLANEEFRRRFKNESKAIAVLSHRNIVKVYDVSFGDRLQYIVMEYIEGVTLKEYIEQRGVISWKEALFFSIQILRALQHAHDKGIVHRDVKPQNIILLENGTIKVTDFGIARFSHSETRTMTEKAIGSVHYISPEQAKGEFTDEKADLYSVGVVLYEMLTGKLPFDADSAVSVALMQVNNEAKLPRKINPEIPLGFEQITMRAMQKSTHDRYQTAAEMLLDLEELKRNPNIKFDYTKFYTDEQPTRYINKIQDSRRISNGVTGEYEKVRKTSDVEARKRVSEAQRQKTGSSKENQKEDNKKKIAVIAGVGVAVAVFLIVILFVNLFGNKIEVHDFYGMNYEEILANKEEYGDYDFEPIYEQFSDGKEDCVFKQDPAAGTKAKKGVTVRLYIAKSGEGQKIPDYEDENYQSTCDSLESMGFVVKAVPVTDSDKPVGNVIRTSPSAGETVMEGSYITVYYSASSKTGVLFDMPDVVGMDINEAEKLLREKGLTIGKKEEVDSSIPDNQVITQSIEEGTPVQKGDVVNLTISTGRAAVDVTFNMPDNAGAVTVKITMNGSTVSSETVDSQFVDVYRISIPANGALNGDIKAYIDDMLYYEVTADFSKTPAKLSSGKYQKLNFYVDVIGMDIENAKDTLNMAGYTHISVIKVESNQPEGTVINQSPNQGSAPNLDKSSSITLTVATAPVQNESTTG